MMHILVATDGSDSAKRAVDVAAHQARDRGADLTIINVISLGEWSLEEFKEYAQVEHLTLADALNAFSEELLKDAARCAIAAGAPSVQTESLSDSEGEGVAASIMDAARARGAGMIVLGRRGLGRLSGLWLGSVSQKVSSLATCPVTLVP